MKKLSFRNFITGTIDILLPPICLGCKAEGFFICDTCRSKIEQYKYFVCPICKRRDTEGRLDAQCRTESGLTRFLGSPLPYSSELTKKIIHAFKYQRAKEIANPLTQILIEFLDKNGFGGIAKKYGQKLYLVPVPLYDFRERERGFNQASEISKRLAEYYKIPHAKKILIKRKNTEPQADIKNKEERAKNIEGAFTISKRGLPAPYHPQQRIGSGTPFLRLDPEKLNKIAILVDDVYTSGATMRECAMVLRSAGAREVWGITVARG